MEKEARFITADEMRGLLRQACARDGEAGLLAALLRRLRDPAAPWDSAGRPRPHPLWTAVLLILLAAAAAFALFSALEP